MIKNVLGRGVEALLPETKQEEESRFFKCDIDKILPNPHQPRSFFDEEKLQQLADSIKEKGVIQPLLVTQQGTRYILIAGERRLRAAKMAGCEEVPIVIMDEGGESENLELALIENIQRHDLNPIEEAKAYARLMEEFSLTQDEVARKVGRKRTTITNILRLLALPQEVQDDVMRGLLSEGHARALLRLKDRPEQLLDIRRRILTEALSVRTTERLCAKKEQDESSGTGKTEDMPPPPPEKAEGALSRHYCASLVNQLTNHFNTKIRIIQQGNRGKLELEYYSPDDLDRLFNLLCK